MAYKERAHGARVFKKVQVLRKHVKNQKKGLCNT